MKKLMLVLVAVVFATMAIGCGGPEPNPTVGGVKLPDWFINPPLEPGKAIYGTGSYTMDSMDEIGLAKESAAAAARLEIAASMKATIQSVLKNYARKIVTPEKKTQYEQLTQSVSRQIVDNTIHGAIIQKQDYTTTNDGKIVWFTLVRIGFDGVAKALADATREEFEKVEENAAQAFAEMDDLLTKNAQGKSNTIMSDEAPTPK